MAQQWRYPLSPIAGAAGNAVTGTSLASTFGGIALPQLPPLDRPGGRFLFEAEFEHTSTSATPTLVLGIYIGSVGQAIGSKTLIAASTTMAISASATSWPIILEFWGRFRTLSPSAGVLYGQGFIKLGASLTQFVAQDYAFPITQALRTVSTLNTDQVNEFDIGATWSSATGSPTITMTDCSVEYSG